MSQLDRDPRACRVCDRGIESGQTACPNGHEVPSWQISWLRRAV